MRSTRLLANIGLLACLVMPSLAQDQPANPKNAPKVELMCAYKTAGASWSYRIVSWQREGDTFSGSESCTVEAVADGEAKLRTQGSNKSGNNSWARTESVKIDSPFSDKADWVDAKLPRETLDLGFAKFPCAKSVEKLGDVQVTRWVSTEWHPLVVKQVKLGAHSGETRTLTSFQSGGVDPFLLYRMKGRSWTIKNTTEIAGMDSMISYMRTTVTAVEATNATISMEFLDKDKQPMAGMQATESKIEFVQTPATVGPGETPQIKHESKSVAAGEFACTYFEFNEVKSWMSSVWPSLMVAMEHQAGTSELVEFDLGHDEWLFYRTAGNSYTVRLDKEIHTYTVREVVGLEATVVKLHGGVTSETKVKFEEKKLPAMPFAGRSEQWVTTPAGSFAAVLTEWAPAENGQVPRDWSWNGIKLKSSGSLIEVELTELKLE